jgi:hypothetical protein
MITKIEISFPVPVSVPPGFYPALTALIDMVCKRYDDINLDRTMWCAEQGYSPIWRDGDISSFDSTTYVIRCAEREELHKR